MTDKNEILNNKRFTFAYFPGDSLMHKLNPLSKILFLIYLTIIVLMASSLILLSLISLSVIILALMSEISLKNLYRKLRFMIIIMIVSVFLNIFFNAIPQEQETILFYLFGLKFLPIRRLAVYFALKAFFIVITLFTSTIIYTNTTNMKDFVYSLMKLKLPYTFCFAFMVGVRYIPMIEQEAKTITLAQRARGMSRDKVNTFKKAYNLIFERLIATLVSILRKAEVTSISMENRGFGLYKERTNLIEVKFKANDIIFMSLITLFFLFVLLYIIDLTLLPNLPSLYSIYRTLIS
jgi:energy-coupling factor transport system permease protein